mmetsp:Transcript_19992/g.63632  ORF Transcript_19992/g.63632 Transcript_19992/m.63632 type:complete len:207 (-) Transcript_19992:360-980(-)
MSTPAMMRTGTTRSPPRKRRRRLRRAVAMGAAPTRHRWRRQRHTCARPSFGCCVSWWSACAGTCRATPTRGRWGCGTTRSSETRLRRGTVSSSSAERTRRPAGRRRRPSLWPWPAVRSSWWAPTWTRDPRAPSTVAACLCLASCAGRSRRSRSTRFTWSWRPSSRTWRRPSRLRAAQGAREQSASFVTRTHIHHAQPSPASSLHSH